MGSPTALSTLHTKCASRPSPHTTLLALAVPARGSASCWAMALSGTPGTSGMAPSSRRTRLLPSRPCRVHCHHPSFALASRSVARKCASGAPPPPRLSQCAAYCFPTNVDTVLKIDMTNDTLKMIGGPCGARVHSSTVPCNAERRASRTDVCELVAHRGCFAPSMRVASRPAEALSVFLPHISACRCGSTRASASPPRQDRTL